MFSSYDFSIFRRERENPPTQPNPKGHVSSSLWFLREKLDFVVPSNQQNFHWFVCHTDSRLYMSVRLDRLVGWLVGCNNYLVSKTHYNLAFQNNIESMPSVFLSISTSINKISIENHSLGKQRESCVFLTENMYNQTLTQSIEVHIYIYWLISYQGESRSRGFDHQYAQHQGQ